MPTASAKGNYVCFPQHITGRLAVHCKMVSACAILVQVCTSIYWHFVT